MNKLIVTLVVGAALMVATSPAAAEWVSVYTQSDDHQDDWFLEGRVHEIGCHTVFPTCQQIECISSEPTEETACADDPGDNPNIPNALVTIKNLCEVSRCELYYVADPETDLSNWDEWVGQVGDPEPEKAFRIDQIGVNKPLFSESMNQDQCFEPGEVWQFIIQDYVNTPPAGGAGGPAHALASIGIASMSAGDTMSTGSIITPEPASLGLIVLGGLALVRRRRE